MHIYDSSNLKSYGSYDLWNGLLLQSSICFTSGNRRVTRRHADCAIFRDHYQPFTPFPDVVHFMYLSKTAIVYSEHAYIFSGTSLGILDADTCIAAQPPKK